MDHEQLIKLLGPLAVPFLAGVGAISLFFWRKRLMGILLGTDEGKSKIRRRDDELIEQLMSQNSEQIDRFMEAWQKNTETLQGALNALRAVAGEVADVKVAQRSLGDSVQIGLRGVHERLDKIVSKAA